MTPFTHAKELALMGIEYGNRFTNWIDKILDGIFEKLDKHIK